MPSFSVYDELARRILVLDGGLGTMIQRYGFGESDYRGERFADWTVPLTGCNDLLVLTRPEAVARVHEAYLRAGADIITTDTFNANAISLADYALGEYVYEINRQAAALARTLADRYTASEPSKPRFVAGSVGPTNRTASLSPDLYDPAARSVTFAELAQTYHEQIRGLIDGGADLILIETFFDALNAKAALYALDELNARSGESIPAMISGTLTDASGRTLAGQTLEAFYDSVRRGSTLSVGLNCGLGAQQMLPFLERIARVADCAVSVHPNAGLPNGSGGYDQTPESMAGAIEEYLRQGLLNIVGGCCGTTPAHIGAIAAVAARYAPRPIPALSTLTRLSGLEDLTLPPDAPFLLIGGRANTDRAAFAEKIRSGQYESALGLVSGQLNGGAQLMGVCLDAEGVDGETAMRSFLNLAMSDPGVARAPWLIDSYRSKVWEAGLQCIQGKSLVRAISLKKGDAGLLENFQKTSRYGAVPILRLADEQGGADSYDRRIGIAGRMYGLLTGAGIRPEEIVFDMMLGPVATEDGAGAVHVRDFIEACRWVKAHCPDARIFCDLDAFSAPYAGLPAVRAALHTVLLYRAVPAGLTLGIGDPSSLTLVYSEMEPVLRDSCEDLVLGRRADAPSRLKAFAEGYSGDGFAAIPFGEDAASCLVRALVRARADDPEALLDEVCRGLAFRPLLEGPWNEAVRRLYTLFECNELFVPQLVCSAGLIRKLSASLVRRLEQPGDASARGRVMIPSLAGDVQDLGKNVLLPLLLARGYAVENLSGRPLAERIVNETVRCGAVALVLSGTLASAREDMVRVAQAARRKEMRVPLLVGGPAVSERWVNGTLAPLYDGPVHYAASPLDFGTMLDKLRA